MPIMTDWMVQLIDGDGRAYAPPEFDQLLLLSAQKVQKKVRPPTFWLSRRKSWPIVTRGNRHSGFALVPMLKGGSLRGKLRHQKGINLVMAGGQLGGNIPGHRRVVGMPMDRIEFVVRMNDNMAERVRDTMRLLDRFID
jgi:hypothetical protein